MPQRGPQGKGLDRQNAGKKENEELRGHRPASAKPSGSAIPKETRRTKGK